MLGQQILVHSAMSLFLGEIDLYNLFSNFLTSFLLFPIIPSEK